MLANNIVEAADGNGIEDRQTAAGTLVPGRPKQAGRSGGPRFVESVWTGSDGITHLVPPTGTQTLLRGNVLVAQLVVLVLQLAVLLFQLVHSIFSGDVVDGGLCWIRVIRTSGDICIPVCSIAMPTGRFKRGASIP